MSEVEVFGPVARVLGGLFRDGASVDLHDLLRSSELFDSLAAQSLPPLAARLTELSVAHRDSTSLALATEFTRLTVANIVDGRRRPVPVPLWEDCWQGATREVLGQRHRQVLLAYASARLGFDGMQEQPVDHIGLELGFVAQLAEEEQSGQRTADARHQFVRDHLRLFAARLGAALALAADQPFWRAVGALLPTVVDGLADPADLAFAPDALASRDRAVPTHLPVVP